MRNQSPQQISIRSAALLAAIATFIFVIVCRIDDHLVSPLVVIIFFLLTFATGFFVLRYVIGQFIYRKIKLIYKTIQKEKSTKSGRKEEEIIHMNEDFVARINRDVEAWADDRRKEIDKLVAEEQYRKEFLGNVSHELKTPIFNIQGYVLTLLEGGLEDPTINRDYLERAAKSVDRMIHIIEDLESISQLEVGELQLYFEKFDLVQMAKDILHAQEMRAQEYNITLGLKENYDKPMEAWADKDRIRQVFTNLVVNSIRYGRENGHTEVRIYDMDENWLVEVADNGIGIPPGHLSRIFERFYRVDKSRSRERGGTGLGLSIVKHIIEAHGQTVNVRSTEGVGSTFSFTVKKGR
ncbi:MAG: sensor histidine kinase [Flavobacteriales bacterium]|nr:sensor histidine kinase [Flavobacteriales bacterium]MCB9446841.1 sensor histidine kinase [Flavobacteriales bacterium]